MVCRFWQIVLKMLWCCRLHPNFRKESCWWNTVVWVRCNMFKEEISIPLLSIHKSNMNWVISCEEIIFSDAMSEKTQWSFVTEARCITVIHHFHKVQDQGLGHVSPRNLCSKQRQFLATFFFFLNWLSQGWEALGKLCFARNCSFKNQI